MNARIAQVNFPRLALALVLLLALAACGGQKSVYPEPEELKLATAQRQEFVDQFLQGRWCQAEALFDMSTEDYLRQDDFCAAAYNYLLAHKLKTYIGQEDRKALEQARRYRELALGCDGDPGLPGSSTGADGSERIKKPSRDDKYLELIANKDFKGFLAAQAGEKDPLFASVYGRKAFAAAAEAGDKETALAIFRKTRAVDAAQGWVVFLVEDWKLRAELAGGTEKELMGQRVKLLRGFIHPCSP